MTEHISYKALEIRELRNGWIDLFLHAEKETFDISVSSLFSDPVRDLCMMFCGLLDNSGDNKPHSEFEWGGEGWVYEVNVRPLQEGRIVTNVAFYGNRYVGEEKMPIWNVTFEEDARKHASSYLKTLGTILRRYGFIRYRELWGKEFPTGQVVLLWALVNDIVPEELDPAGQLAALQTMLNTVAPE